jgi:DNA-binding response OmpR family regulator
MRVLLAEDDAHIRAAVAEILEGEGYSVVEAPDGEQAIALFRNDTPDFVCLDIMMPGMSGYDVCREIRRENQVVPIIFLSAKSEEIDKVLGLELGADDYIMKPFGKKEFVARMRAISRRCLATSGSTASKDVFSLGDLEVSPAELRARRGDQALELSLREVRILRLFFEHAGEVVDRDLLFRECWGIDSYPNSRTIDQHISKLRKKVERDARSPEIIKTVHGAGYRYENH